MASAGGREVVGQGDDALAALVAHHHAPQRCQLILARIRIEDRQNAGLIAQDMRASTHPPDASSVV